MRKKSFVCLCMSFFLLAGGWISDATTTKIAYVNVSIAGVFAKNSNKSEQVTEVLLGDEIEITKHYGEWVYGYIPSQKNYPGWIRKKDIFFATSNSPFKDKSLIHVSTKECRLSFKDGTFINLYAGTRLPVLRKTDDQYEVIMPDGTKGFLPGVAGLLENDSFGKGVTPKDIMVAADFFGSDYKWGGITAGGMDCSGFVYTVFRVNGIFLKRDSYMQATEGSGVRPEELDVGDLVFFSKGKGNRITHVGIYIGNGDFIHSSKGNQGVAISSLSENYYKKRFVTARRLLNHNNITAQEDKKQAIYIISNVGRSKVL